MATELHYDDEARLMRTRAYGKITIEDLTSHPQRQIAAAPDDVGVLYEVLDAREATDISASILMLVPEVRKMLSQLEHFKGVCMAVISNDEYVVGHANQLATVFLQSSVVIQVFRKEEEALAWLDDQRKKDET